MGVQVHGGRLRGIGVSLACVVGRTPLPASLQISSASSPPVAAAVPVSLSSF
jgi:hypothetical protein